MIVCFESTLIIMRPLSHLKHWEAHSIDFKGEQRRVYLPIRWVCMGQDAAGKDILEQQHYSFSPSEIARMKRGYAPKHANLDVHHMVRQDGSFVLMPDKLHHGNRAIEIREPSRNGLRMRSKTPHQILHACPPIEKSRLIQLQQLLLNKNPFSLAFGHQEPSKAKHDGDFKRWKSTIWRGYATYLERLQHGLAVDDYRLPHPQEESIISYFQRIALAQWRGLRGGLFNNEDVLALINLTREQYPVLSAQDIVSGVLKYLAS